MFNYVKRVLHYILHLIVIICDSKKYRLIK